MKHAKIIAFVGVVCLLIVFAAVRVWPYMSSPRSSSKGGTQQGLSKIVVHATAPEFAVEESEDEADRLAEQIHRMVGEAMKGLPPSQRPNEFGVRALASAYAEFVITRRTGTLDEYLEACWYKPTPELQNEDKEKAEMFWRYNTAWARVGDIDVSSIRIVPRHIRGVPITNEGEEPSQRGVIYYRELRNGGHLPTDGPGALSVYEVFLSVTVPSIDAKEDFAVELGTMMMNDGPNGRWGPVATELIGVPMGKFAYTPRP